MLVAFGSAHAGRRGEKQTGACFWWLLLTSGARTPLHAEVRRPCVASQRGGERLSPELNHGVGFPMRYRYFFN